MNRQYTFTVTFTRELGDDLEVVGHWTEEQINAAVRDKLVQQFRKELQAAYDHPDTAIAGRFNIDQITIDDMAFPAAQPNESTAG